MSHAESRVPHGFDHSGGTGHLDMGRVLPAMRSGPAGETVTLPTNLPPGETCRLEYRGSSWSAINGGEAVIAAGSRVRIERVDGLTLVVRGEV